jgi:RND family efflux transporter MFP subunit
MARPTENDATTRPMAKAAGLLATLAVVAAVAGGLAAIALATEPYGPSDGDKVPPIVVRVQEARRLDEYAVAREFVGVVEARRESSVGFELPGELAEVLFDEGEFIEGGTVVARLDTSILEAEKAALVAARDQARAATELAAITRKRMADALEREAASAHEWDKADKDYQAQVAALARAEAAVAAINTRIARAELKSPFPALVAERLADEGQVLAAGAPVLHLLERVEPEVRIGVAGDSIDTISRGDEFTVLVRGRNVPATVKSVLPVRGNGTRSVDVLLTLHAEFDGIRRGDLATLVIERSEPEAGFWLPLSALTESSRGLWACYVAHELAEHDRAGPATHRLRRRELEVIHQEADRVFVRGTLGDGELVVGEGLQRLVPDQLVSLADAGAFSTLGGGS